VSPSCLRRALLSRRAILALSLTIALGACGGGDSQSPTQPEEPAPTTGSVAIQASTTGDTLDADGYTVTVDGTEESLTIDGSVTYSGLSEGDYTAQLNGIQKNCSASTRARTATVTAGDTASLTFDVTCDAALFDRTLVEV